jgi:cytochrome c-type biogenesis protein CcmE
MALSRLGRLLVVGFVLSSFILLMSFSIRPMPQYSIDELMDDSDTHVGERIHIRGTIVNGSLNTESSLVTLIGIDDTIIIDISGLSIPVGFEEGKMVSVKGILKISDDNLIIRADEIQTGCPSKYDPASS